MESSTIRVREMMRQSGTDAWFTLSKVFQEAQIGTRPWWHLNVAYTTMYLVEEFYSYHDPDTARFVLSLSREQAIALVERVGAKFTGNERSRDISEKARKLIHREITKMQREIEMQK